MIDPVPRSRKRIAPFRLHRPETVAAAVALLATLPDAVAMAGGIEVLGRMKAGWQVPHVVLLRDIAPLSAVHAGSQGLSIGSGVLLQDLSRHETVRRQAPDIARAMAPVANVRIRHQATLGGNILAGVAHYDVLPCLMALGAHLDVATADGPATIPAATLAATPGAMPVHALLTGVRVPTGARLLCHHRDMLPAFLLTLGEQADGTLHAAVAGAHQRPCAGPLGIAASDLHGAGLTATRAGALAEAWCAALPAMRDTLHMSAAWRRRVVPVVLARLLAGLAAPAGSLAA